MKKRKKSLLFHSFNSIIVEIIRTFHLCLVISPGVSTVSPDFSPFFPLKEENGGWEWNLLHLFLLSLAKQTLFLYNKILAAGCSRTEAGCFRAEALSAFNSTL